MACGGGGGQADIEGAALKLNLDIDKGKVVFCVVVDGIKEELAATERVYAAAAPAPKPSATTPPASTTTPTPGSSATGDGEGGSGAGGLDLAHIIIIASFAGVLVCCLGCWCCSRGGKTSGNNLATLEAPVRGTRLPPVCLSPRKPVLHLHWVSHFVTLGASAKPLPTEASSLPLPLPLPLSLSVCLCPCPSLTAPAPTSAPLCFRVRCLLSLFQHFGV